MNDSSEKPRMCLNCACFALIPHPFDNFTTVSVCRRNQANLATATGETPRIGLRGEPVLGKDGKPIMERVNKTIYVYPATEETSVCFDGWRAIGMLPGDRYNPQLDPFIAHLSKAIDSLLANAMVKTPLDG